MGWELELAELLHVVCSTSPLNTSPVIGFCVAISGVMIGKQVVGLMLEMGVFTLLEVER